MTDTELKKILGTVQSNYLNHYKLLDEFSGPMVFETWKYQLGNMPYEVVFRAIQDYISVKPSHPPTIAHINEIIFNYMNVENISADDCFAKVLRHIDRYGSAADEYDRLQLSDLEKKVVTKGKLKEIGQSQNISYEKNMFVKHFNETKTSYNLKVRSQLKLLTEEKILMLIDKKQFLLE